MLTFWIIVYNIVVVPILWILFMIGGLLKQKYRVGIKGRLNLFDNLRTQLDKLPEGSNKIWFHASSLGEFEQAKAIIAELKKNHPEIKIIVSFFSPSGYEPSKKYKLADAITYIPFDSYRNAGKFIKMIKPKAAVMIRYDLWPNHIWALKQQHVPVFIANATMRENTIRRFPVLKSFHSKLYNAVNYILTVSEKDLKTFDIFKLTSPKMGVMGDSRYDQVWQRSIDSKKKHLMPEKILSGKNVFIVGSSWEADEKILFPVFFKLQQNEPDLLMILVPHEPTENNLERIESELNGQTTHIRFSELNDYAGERVLIVDSIGILMVLYQYAHIAFIGGSFRGGVHNVLEPAVYGIPVIFGPNHTNSQEAILLLNEKIAFMGSDDEEMYRILRTLLSDETIRSESGQKAFLFIKKNIGATQKFLSYFQKVLVN
jgi:3-deoxy-D-manno-octulosonic-acid transferase